MEDYQEIKKRLREIEIQYARFQGHFESELGNITRQLNDLNKEIKELRGFKNNLEGQLLVLKVVAGAAVTLWVALVLWVITNKL